jgi:sugar lactone lactonase YvrE
MAVDAEGHLWVCHWGGSRVSRFAPDGTLERIVPIPTAQVTKCAFGGPDLTTLYVTTAAIGRDPTIDVMAGHVFAVQAGVAGLPAHILAS